MLHTPYIFGVGDGLVGGGTDWKADFQTVNVNAFYIGYSTSFEAVILNQYDHGV